MEPDPKRHCQALPTIVPDIKAELGASWNEQVPPPHGRAHGRETRNKILPAASPLHPQASDGAFSSSFLYANRGGGVRCALCRIGLRNKQDVQQHPTENKRHTDLCRNREEVDKAGIRMD